jgi:magnesium transporter
LVSIFLHKDGKTEPVSSIDRRWLNPASGAFLWVDLAAPSIPESLILKETFAFHPLAVEDALSERQFPKAEAYDGYLYVILHGIDFRLSDQCFATHDVDFFLGPTYLVTIHDGTNRSISELRDHCPRNTKLMAEGPVSLFHRIVDSMVDHYRPEIDKLEERIDELEEEVFLAQPPEFVREILKKKRDVSSLRRIITPQRDVIARLARRDFVDISTEMSFRFRDVHDHLVRVTDDSLVFQDRITGILDAHLSNVSNRLNEVMKVLTIASTLLLPPTMLAGFYGMNVPLPHFPGGEHAQFWWLAGICLTLAGTMLAYFRRRRWI